MRQVWRVTAGISLNIVLVCSTLSLAQEIPGTPTNVVAVAGAGSLNISWNAPTSGPPPTAYRLDIRITSTIVASVTVGLVTNVAVPIPPGTQGTFSVSVTALNGTTPGAPSAPATFTLGGGCTPPPTPTGLTGTFANGTAAVQWNGAPGATNYIVQAGSVQFASDLFNAPVGNTTSVSASNLPPDFRAYVRVMSQNSCGISPPAPDFLLGGTITPPPPSVCVPSPARVCAFDRFQIDVTFNDGLGRSGPAAVTPGGRYVDGGEFYFFNPSNVDLLVQVLNRCSSNNRYWIFMSGSTNAEVRIQVTDTTNGTRKEYFNPLNQAFQPVTDTAAFATCP